jgi:hypothetical protein
MKSDIDAIEAACGGIKTISELIRALEAAKEKYGDIRPVAHDGGDGGDPGSIYGEFEITRLSWIPEWGDCLFIR